MSVSATDAAVKLAEENGIDLANVTGTGADGRITKGDVLRQAPSTSSGQAQEPVVGEMKFDAEDTAVSEEFDTDMVETAVATVSELETAVSLTFGRNSLHTQTAEAEADFSALTALIDEPEAVVEAAPLFAWRVENAATLQELIALGGQATSEAERAAIRVRAMEMLKK